MLKVDDVYDESVFAWHDDDKKLQVCRVRPNYMLLRKCKKPATTFLIGESQDEENSRLVEGILQDITERPDFRYSDGWCSVLAVGDKREWSKDEIKRYDIPKGYHCPAKRGDLVCIPESSQYGCHWRCGITGKDYDIVVAEFEPFLWFPQGVTGYERNER